MRNWLIGLAFMPGFALAEASSDTWSGFASFVAGQLEILEPLPNWLICLLVSTISIFLTEITEGGVKMDENFENSLNIRKTGFFN